MEKGVKLTHGFKLFQPWVTDIVNRGESK